MARIVVFVVMVLAAAGASGCGPTRAAQSGGENMGVVMLLLDLKEENTKDGRCFVRTKGPYFKGLRSFNEPGSGAGIEITLRRGRPREGWKPGMPYGHHAGMWVERMDQWTIKVGYTYCNSEVSPERELEAERVLKTRDGESAVLLGPDSGNVEFAAVFVVVARPPGGCVEELVSVRSSAPGSE